MRLMKSKEDNSWQSDLKWAVVAAKRRAFKKGLPMVTLENNKFYFTFRGKKKFELSIKEAQLAIDMELSLENFTNHFKIVKIK